MHTLKNFQVCSLIIIHCSRCSVSVTTDEWAKLDDDRVSIVKEEQVLKLSGGGDWHVAYILLYAPRRLEIFKEEEGEGEKVSEWYIAIES